MPGRNGTGPMGYGPMTGRGMGPCGGGAAYRGRFFGRRAGMGYGAHYGRGFGGAGYYEPQEFSAEQQKEILEDRKSFLENELKDLQKKLDEL